MKKFSHDSRDPAHLLILGQNKVMRLMVQAFLAKYGWKISEAEDTKSAIVVLCEQKPDLLVIDYVTSSLSSDVAKQIREAISPLNIPFVGLVDEIGGETDRFHSAVCLGRPLHIDSLVKLVTELHRTHTKSKNRI